MSERVLVLSADAWRVTDEKTGEINSGISCWYLSNYREGDGVKEVGLKPIKIQATPEIFDILRANDLPAYFDLDYGSRPGSQNKAALTVIKAKFVTGIDLYDQKLMQPAKVAA